MDAKNFVTVAMIPVMYLQAVEPLLEVKHTLKKKILTINMINDQIFFFYFFLIIRICHSNSTVQFSSFHHVDKLQRYCISIINYKVLYFLIKGTLQHSFNVYLIIYVITVISDVF